MKSLIYCFLIILLPVQGAEVLAADTVSSYLSSFREIYSATSGDHPVKAERLIRDADAAFSKEIVQLYKREPSVDALKGYTKNLAVWQEWPSEYSDDRALALISARTNLLVFYREFTNGQNRLLCFGALFPTRPDRYPVLAGIHVVNLWTNGDIVHDLPEVGGQYLSELYVPPLCLGFVKREGAPPVVFWAEGPVGSGKFVRGYRFDAAAQSVKKEEIFAFSPVRQFEYFEDENIFRYTIRLGNSNDGATNVTREFEVRD